MGKLAEKKIRNRQAILEAAFEVFIGIGFENCTVADIVQGSGLARGTFYNYFQTKEEVWEAITSEILGDIAERARQARRSAEDARSFVADAYRAYFGLIIEDPRLLRMLVRNQTWARSSIFTGFAMESVIQQLEEDMQRSGFFDHMDARQIRLATFAMIGAAFEILVQAANKGMPIDPQILSEELAEMFVFGIGQPSR